MKEPLVDLLLVRLGGEEERKKVTRLLVMELDMTVGEAEKAVENSPMVIREGVAIGEARIVQKNLYPYVDLLPRLEEDGSGSLRDKVRFVLPPSDDDHLLEDSDDGYNGASETFDDDGLLDDEDEGGDEEEHEEFLLTTASEEMLQIDRCHICGKTPVGGEKLAPCRACEELTCRECFDRTAHVCRKCAAVGHTFDRPMAAKPRIIARQGSSESPPPREAREAGGKRTRPGKALPVVIAAALLAVLGIVFLPGLFSGTEPPREDSISDAGTAAPPVPDNDTAILPDTAGPAPSQAGSDPIGVAALSLPDSLFSASPFPVIEAYTRVPPNVGASGAAEELRAVLPQLEALAHHSGIVVDRAALLVYGDPGKTDHLSVLVLAVNHPENNENRFALLASVGEWLIPGGIDQLVLIYRETRFHQPQFFSYTSISYPELAEAFSPGKFQDLAGTHDAVWASLTGPVTEWICGV